jgi:hypothetical protein
VDDSGQHPLSPGAVRANPDVSSDQGSAAAWGDHCVGGIASWSPRPFGPSLWWPSLNFLSLEFLFIMSGRHREDTTSTAAAGPIDWSLSVIFATCKFSTS